LAGFLRFVPEVDETGAERFDAGILASWIAPRIGCRIQVRGQIPKSKTSRIGAPAGGPCPLAYDYAPTSQHWSVVIGYVSLLSWQIEPIRQHKLHSRVSAKLYEPVSGVERWQYADRPKLKDRNLSVIARRQEYSSTWHYWTNRSRPFQMLDVLDYLLRSFHRSTDWNDDNFYSNLTLTSKSLSPGFLFSLLDLLDFATPRGLRSHTASFVSEQFTAAATLSALPILDGSLAYTYTSKLLPGVQGTASSALIDLVQGFREIRPPRAPDEAKDWEIWQAGRRVDFRGYSRRFSVDSRHFILWTNVFSIIEVRGNAHKASLSSMAVCVLLCFRPKSWQGQRSMAASLPILT